MNEAATELIKQLLTRRKRRTVILYRWHSNATPPCPGNTLTDILQEFFRTILYLPISLSMTRDALYPFGLNREGLQIPYRWLLPHERKLACQIYQQKNQLFRKHRTFQQHNGFSLSECIYPIEWKLQHRRELLRDFITICHIQRNPTTWEQLHYALLRTAYYLLHNSQHVCDPFVIPMLRVLFGLCTVEQMLVITG